MKSLKERIRSGIRTGCYLGITTLMATASLSIATGKGAPGTSESAPVSKQLPRKIYGHYMGCYPVGDIGRDDVDRKGFRHDSSHLETASGGRWKGYPLVPVGVKLTMDEKADLEIRRALRSGLDGFAIDAWAGGDGAKAFLDALFRVADAKDYPFEITICLDHSCLKPLGGGQEPYLAAIRYVLDNHGSSKHLARRDGKPLFFAYASRGILGSQFMEDESKWPLFGAAYKELQEKVGQPLYFQVDIGNFFARAKKRGDFADAAAFVAKDVGAVGFFLDGDFVPDLKRVAKAVREAGGEWSPPIWFQYDNGAGLFFPPVGTSILRRTWEGARDEGATLLQFVTWNDYTEYTSLAPTTSTGYGIGDLNRYLAEWWKQGTPPEIDHDRIYVAFHK